MVSVVIMSYNGVSGNPRLCVSENLSYNGVNDNNDNEL